MAEVVNPWDAWMARGPFTPVELAEMFRVTPRTIERWCQIGELPARKVGAQWRIPYGGLEEYLAGQGVRVVSARLPDSHRE